MADKPKPTPETPTFPEANTFFVGLELDEKKRMRRGYKSLMFGKQEVKINDETLIAHKEGWRAVKAFFGTEDNATIVKRIIAMSVNYCKAKKIKY